MESRAATATLVSTAQLSLIIVTQGLNNRVGQFRALDAGENRPAVDFDYLTAVCQPRLQTDCRAVDYRVKLGILLPAPIRHEDAWEEQLAQLDP